MPNNLENAASRFATRRRYFLALALVGVNQPIQLTLPTARPTNRPRMTKRYGEIRRQE